jgi:hypothetical protein
VVEFLTILVLAARITSLVIEGWKLVLEFQYVIDHCNNGVREVTVVVVVIVLVMVT